MRRFLTVLAVAGAVGAATPASASADIRLRYFNLTPSCVPAGGAVSYSVGIHQSHLFHVHTLWARVVVRHAVTGLVVAESDSGPEYVPYGDYSSSGTEAVPANAPPGDYTVSLSLGSSRGASNWGSATRTIKVAALGVCL